MDIAARVARLAADPRGAAVFGANGHGFRLNPPASHDRVADVERTWGFCVPPAYRTFLTEVGDGGAGPGYGLSRLGRYDGTDDDAPVWDEFLVGDPGRPFPHDAAWNLPADRFDVPEFADDAAETAWFERFDATYYDPHLVDGAIPVAHLGCAIRVFLVVTGPRSGQVWTDSRTDHGGLFPCEPVGFADWYDAWLTECEAQVRRGR